MTCTVVFIYICYLDVLDFYLEPRTGLVTLVLVWTCYTLMHLIHLDELELDGLDHWCYTLDLFAY